MRGYLKFVLLFAAPLVLTIVGCGGGEKSATEINSEQQEEFRKTLIEQSQRERSEG
jgi:hypothetical protein